MLSTITRAAGALAIAALLSACGGGTDSAASNAQVAARMFEHQTARADAALCAAQASTTTEAMAYQEVDGQCTRVFTGGDGKLARALAARVVRAARAVDANALMNWAQQAFTPLFPDNSPNITISGWTVRYYPSTQNYLGVADDGGVYLLGPLTGNTLAKVGKLADFGCAVYPDSCQPDTPGYTFTLTSDKALVLQGSTATVTVNLTRNNGFDGAVNIGISQLPDGVTASTATLANGATSATITLSAKATAPHSTPTTALVNATAGDRTDTKPLTVTVRGLPGSVDTSFGANGKIILPVGTGEDYGNAVAVQSDGKIIVAGSSAISTGTVVSLARFSRDGQLDVTFGIGGKVLTAVGDRSDAAYALALQPDGKIVVAGRSDQTASGNGYDFMVLRYTVDGALDTTFGNGGKVLTDIAHKNDIAHALLIQADGKIVVGGESLVNSSTTGVDFALARYNSNGALDATFGNGGTLTTAVKTGTGSDVVRALALQTVDGEQRILAVGGDGDFLAARYTANGSLDASFANNGKLVGVFNSNIGAANAVVVLPNGKAVLAGQRDHDFALVQLLPNGALDPSFATGGKMVYPITLSNWDEATSIVRQADGKLVVGGWVYSGNSSSGDFVIQRYTDNGFPDDTFGDHSTVILPMANGTLSDLAHGLVLQPDERLPAVRVIQVGEANGSNNDFAITRFWL
jgi:uncharacterized delta-60 repeat protein